MEVVATAFKRDEAIYEGSILPKCGSSEIPSFLNYSKPRGLIHTKLKEGVSALQRKALNVLYYNASRQLREAIRKNPQQLYQILKARAMIPFIIDMNELDKIVNAGLKPSSRYKTSRIVEAVKQLRKIDVEYNYLLRDSGIVRKDLFNSIFEIRYDSEDIPEFKGWGISSLIESVHIERDPGGRRLMYYYIPFQVAIRLLAPKRYTRNNVLVPSLIKGRYDVAIYEVLNDFYQMSKHISETHKKNAPMQHTIPLREFMQVVLHEKDYRLKDLKGAKEFRLKILKPAIERLNSMPFVSFAVEVNFEKRENTKHYDTIVFTFSTKKEAREPVLVDGNLIFSANGSATEKEVANESTESAFKKKMAEAKEKNDLLSAFQKGIMSGSISYTDFKRELLRTKNLEICDSVPGKIERLVLRTNEFGYLELYDKKEERSIELDFKEAEEIRRWIFSNPENIGAFWSQNIIEPPVCEEEDGSGGEEIGKFMIVSDRGSPLGKSVIKILKIKKKINEITSEYQVLLPGGKKTVIKAPPVEELSKFFFENENEAKRAMILNKIKEERLDRRFYALDGKKFLFKGIRAEDGGYTLVLTDLSAEREFGFGDAYDLLEFMRTGAEREERGE